MFKVGETIFCPIRGSGIVEAIEARTMLGESKEYVIIHMKSPELMMMIPTDRLVSSGFRNVNDEAEADKVLSILEKKEIEVDYSVDIKQRVKQNQAKLSSGSFIQCSEVVRDLSHMEHIKTLNNSEKTMLMQAKRLLVDEFSIIKQISDTEASEAIDQLLEAYKE